MYRLRRKKKHPVSRTNLPNFLIDVATTSRKKKVSSFENKLEKNLPRMNEQPRTENSHRKQKPKLGRSNTEPLAVLQRKNTHNGASNFLYIRYKNPIRFEKLTLRKKRCSTTPRAPGGLSKISSQNFLHQLLQKQFFSPSFLLLSRKEFFLIKNLRIAWGSVMTHFHQLHFSFYFTAKLRTMISWKKISTRSNFLFSAEDNSYFLATKNMQTFQPKTVSFCWGTQIIILMNYW